MYKIVENMIIEGQYSVLNDGQIIAKGLTFKEAEDAVTEFKRLRRLELEHDLETAEVVTNTPQFDEKRRAEAKNRIQLIKSQISQL